MMQAMAKTAMSMELVRSRWWHRAQRCSIITVSHFAKQDNLGARLADPSMAHCNSAPPCQGALLILCHSSRPKTHVLITPLLTEPAPYIITKVERRKSEASI